MEVSVVILPESQQQHFRLLELPAELLTLVTSQDAPILQLKSQESTDGVSKPANLVLCTPEKTFNIRQVNSSNSVWITQTVLPKADVEDASDLVGIETIAKLESTIELSPAPKQSAVPYIKSILPMFLSSGNASSNKLISIQNLFHQIPLDQAACRQAFTDLACFATSDRGACFVPSNQVKAQILERITPTAIAAGVDITITSFATNQAPVFASELSEDWPPELVLSVLLSVSVLGEDGAASVDRAKFVRHTGLVLLQTRSEKAATNSKSFLEAWQNAMPEPWRNACDLSVIKSCHTLHDGGANISYLQGSDPIYDSTSSSTVSGSANTSNKRKWHERFRPTKTS